MKRLKALDLMRGLGISAMVFLHAATFHFEGITSLDFNNPPLIITIIGFLLMWAGLFAIISASAYTFTSGTRWLNKHITPQQLLKNFLSAGVYLLALHYLYFLFLAPKLLDIPLGNHQYALLPGFLANGSFPPIYPERLFYATTLSMIAWNLLLIAPVMYLLARNVPKLERMGIWLASLGTFIMILSIIRIPLYPVAIKAINEGALSSVFWGFLINKNNPILPYLAFGFFGAWLGLSLVKGISARALRPIGIAGILWLIAGLAGLFLLPATMLEREIDLFWYFLTMLQLGLFLILLVTTLFLFDVKGFEAKPLSSMFRLMGLSSLTVFLLETPLAEILAKLTNLIIPGWNNTINGCLVFGLVNVVIWFGIMGVWANFKFKYSAEWFTVKVYGWLKRPSNKLPDLQRPESEEYGSRGEGLV